MANPNIPVTQARLAQSVEIRLMIPAQINLGGVISYQVSNGVTLGTIQKMTREQKRTNKRRYSLGLYAFEPYDIIPGQITTSLILEKVVLYNTKSATVDLVNAALGLSPSQAPTIDGDILSLFGFIGGNLLYQQDAVCVQEVVHPPDDSDPIITTYYDCWFDNNPIEYDISTDQAKLIIQKATMTVGRVVSSVTAQQAEAAIIKSILPSSINL